MLWNLECPVGLSQKRNMCAFRMNEIGRNLVRSADGDKKELRDVLEFSRPKVAHPDVA